MLAEKLSWLREALPGVEDEEGKVGAVLTLSFNFGTIDPTVRSLVLESCSWWKDSSPDLMTRLNRSS